MYTVGGLFSGIGGIENGFEKVGFKKSGDLFEEAGIIDRVVSTIININYIQRI